ncbi:expressed unknown protein [Seminavis robusta]|uniref:Uncharacterized protein n=1 Tax=Seminavis robusta TaxID=568900 RepID=A0A9N8E6J5_9STRA|nr:expressed unknown protein [Seminavis robusta]|eukprot:Sro726_g193470.1 n/a (455) ;mRNA; f:26524-27990
MNGIEITVDHDSLALKTEVMTLRDALHACRSSHDELEPTDDSSGQSSVSQVRDNKSSPTQVKEAVYQDGATPLFKAIEEVNWREALRITEESPSQAFTWVKSTGTQNTTFDWSLWRRLPLHEACRRQAPAWLVSALLSVYPEAAKCATQFGELPLHLAVGSGAAPEVVNLIVVAHWEGIACRDKSGRTPIEIWDECELLVDEDHRVVFESLTRCHNTYTRLQEDWQNKFIALKKQHEAALFGLNLRHDDEMKKENEKKAELEQELNKLHQSVEMLTAENIEHEEKVSSFAKVERTWLERVDSLTKAVEQLQVEKAEEQENVEALHQLVEDKDIEVKALSAKTRKLTKDVQQVMAWYNQTEEGLSRTQESLQQMVDNYVEVHGKLSREKEALQRMLAKRGIDLPATQKKKFSPRALSPIPSDFGSDVSSIMDDAAHAVAAAASAALTGHLIDGPD